MSEIQAIVRNRIIETIEVDASELTLHPMNWRDHPDQQVQAVEGLLHDIGIVQTLVAYYSQRAGGKLVLIDGHLRQGLGGKWPVTVTDLTDEEADLILATLHPTGDLAKPNMERLSTLLASLNMKPVESPGLLGLLNLLKENSLLATKSIERNPQEEARASLNERFIVPPFSVLDARQGYWQDRKRAWIGLGIQSEIGRVMTEDSLNDSSDYGGYSPNFAKPQRMALETSATVQRLKPSADQGAKRDRQRKATGNG